MIGRRQLTWKKQLPLLYYYYYYYYYYVLLLSFLLVIDTSIQVAEAATKVKFLPGFDGPLPFQLETGYIGVGEKDDVQLFYYFIKSDSSDNPEKDPLILWLTGGPGCSGLSALIYEIGPINFEPLLCPGSIPKLSLNPHSWTKKANIVFLDLPVGTGFSYRRTPEASHSTDLQACDQAYEFLRKWIVEHPEFMFSPVFVGGDSYSGITVPIVTQVISDGNYAGMQPRIDLKGYLLGNPYVTGSEINYRVQFAHGKGLISDELCESLKETCGGNYFYPDPANVLCSKNMHYFDQMLSNLDFAHILEPNCPLVSPKPTKSSFVSISRSLYEILHVKPQVLKHNDQCTPYSCRMDSYHLSYYWADDEHVRAALHVRKGTKGKWERCSNSLSYTYTTGNSLPYIANLSTMGYRSLVYSGDHDLVVPFLGTEAWIRSLNYPIVDDWRQWIVHGQVAGYTRTYANQMTFATVKGAGHTAPEYKRPECKAMFERWISSQPL